MKKKILLSASLFHATNDAVSVSVPMIFPLLYSQQVIISKYSHIGILSNLGLLVTLVFQVIIANSSYKFKYKQMLLASILGLSFSLALIPFSRDFLSLLAFYLTLRAFTSFYHPVGVSMVSKTHPEQGIDFAMGIQSGSGNLGVFIAFVSVGYLAQNYGWQVPLYAWAAVSISVGLASFFTVRKISTMQEDIHKPRLSSWIESLKSIKKFIPAFVFGGACWGTTVYYAPSLLNHRFHVSLGSTGIILAAWIGIGTVMTYFFGKLSRRIGRDRIARVGLLGATLCLFLLGSVPVLAMAVISLLFFGLCLFLIYPAFQSFVGNKVPFQNQTLAFSLVANVQMLSGAVVGLIAGYLSDSYGINSPFLLLGFLGVLISTFYLLPRSPIAQNNLMRLKSSH